MDDLINKHFDLVSDDPKVLEWSLKYAEGRDTLDQLNTKHSQSVSALERLEQLRKQLEFKLKNNKPQIDARMEALLNGEEPGVDNETILLRKELAQTEADINSMTRTKRIIEQDQKYHGDKFRETQKHFYGFIYDAVAVRFYTQAHSFIEEYVKPLVELKFASSVSDWMDSKHLKENHTYVRGMVNSDQGGALYMLHLSGNVPSLPVFEHAEKSEFMLGLIDKLIEKAGEPQA